MSWRQLSAPRVAAGIWECLLLSVWMGQQLTSGFLILTQRDVTSSWGKEDAPSSAQAFSWERASSKVTESGQTPGLSLCLSGFGTSTVL